MTLNKLKTMKEERGFTIVELLIVIVVIAILAAIVIVAYNGVQNRARDAQYKSDAGALVKVAEALNADTGAYPVGTNTSTLTSSFNSGTTADIPSGIAITYLATGGTAPTYAAALAAADGSPRTYTVEVCGASVGAVVYYPQRSSTSAAQTMNIGAGC